MERITLPPPRLLTIGGSDSGGAAGIQADLKTWTALGVYGMSALTVVTAQNSMQVAATHALSPAFVRAQLRAVVDDYGVDGVKTGFLGSVALIEAVADELAALPQACVVVDPVLVNHRSEPLFAPEVAAAYRERLLPLATLVTPNRAEAALLANRPVASVDDMAAAGVALLPAGPGGILVTGGRKGEKAVDVLVSITGVRHHTSPWIETTNNHGSGDTLSAAVAALLARGWALPEAVAAGRRAAAQALAGSAGWRFTGGHGPLCHWAITPPALPT